MRAVGLITEYNPFHNGHQHHLRESLRVTGAEVAVAVMSGHFLQRGEPALVDKWVRAEMALRAGVDVVVELPFPWACNSAPQFALGAVRALQALGVDALCFGSESGERAALQRCAELLITEDGRIAEGTALLLRRGINYPTARACCLAELGVDAAELLAAPNNILGIEYLKALRQAGAAIVPHTIPRIGAGFHEERPVGDIASATGIRHRLGRGEEVADFIPLPARAPFAAALAAGQRLDEEHLCRLLLARLLRGADSLRRLYQVEEGVAERLCAAALHSEDYAGLVAAVKSRHLTRTRVQRLLAYVLNEVTAEEMTAWLESGPLYLHLLGATEKGRVWLAGGRKARTLPLVGNYSRIDALLKKRYGVPSRAFSLAAGMLRLETRATANYTLLMQRWRGGSRARDYFIDVLS
jgi:predicted nucleotidyltransferase